MYGCQSRSADFYDLLLCLVGILAELFYCNLGRKEEMNMDYVVDMKPLMRISKYGVRNIIGKMLDYSEKYEYTYTLDTTKCKELMHCPIAKEYESLKETIQAEKTKAVPDMAVIVDASERMKEIASSCAASHCSFCQVTKRYVNDRKRYNMYNENYANRRLPKSMIRTYLYLYSLPQEVLGGMHFIRDISIELLSSELGLCRATVTKSIETLSAFNYITVSHSSSHDAYNIIINDYDTMHLPASKGGTGYFTITSDMMRDILKISNVNALRLEILKLLKCDDDTLHNVSLSEYKIKDLGNIMPAHTNYPGLYQDINEKQPSLFISEVKDGKLHFSLKSGYSLRISSDDFIINSYDEIEAHVKIIGLNIDRITLLNVCELSREYTINNIKCSLSQLVADYKLSFSDIHNFGALLRTYCRKNFIRTAA